MIAHKQKKKKKAGKPPFFVCNHLRFFPIR